MTNFEKMKRMQPKQEFLSAIASLATTIKVVAEKEVGKHVPNFLWGLLFVSWLEEFMNKPYDGVFEKE